MTDKEYDKEIAQQLHGSMRGIKKRYIICAANWYNDGIIRTDEPVESGFVVTGRRHHNIFITVAMLCDFQQDRSKLIELNNVCEQGFLTNDNVWVDRKEAALIAIQAGQITRETPMLFSEDLY